MVTDDTILSIPQHQERAPLHIPPNRKEVQFATMQIKTIKLVALQKSSSLVARSSQTDFMNLSARYGMTPPDLRNANIVTIYKKGDKLDCGNYRGIALLSIAGKILARVLLNRLLPLTEEILPATQFGFRPSRGTTDMIFVARQIHVKFREQNQELFMAIIDITKASDSINREALWKVLSRFGCPANFITILRLLHDCNRLLQRD